MRSYNSRQTCTPTLANSPLLTRISKLLATKVLFRTSTCTWPSASPKVRAFSLNPTITTAWGNNTYQSLPPSRLGGYQPRPPLSLVGRYQPLPHHVLWYHPPQLLQLSMISPSHYHSFCTRGMEEHQDALGQVIVQQLISDLNSAGSPSSSVMLIWAVPKSPDPPMTTLGSEELKLIENSSTVSRATLSLVMAMLTVAGRAVTVWLMTAGPDTVTVVGCITEPGHDKHMEGTWAWQFKHGGNLGMANMEGTWAWQTWREPGHGKHGGNLDMANMEGTWTWQTWREPGHGKHGGNLDMTNMEGTWAWQTWREPGHGKHGGNLGMTNMEGTWAWQTWREPGHDKHGGNLGMTNMEGTWAWQTWREPGHDKHGGNLGMANMEGTWAWQTWREPGHDKHGGNLGMANMEGTWTWQTWREPGHGKHGGNLGMTDMEGTWAWQTWREPGHGKHGGNDPSMTPDRHAILKAFHAGVGWVWDRDYPAHTHKWR